MKFKQTKVAGGYRAKHVPVNTFFMLLLFPEVLYPDDKQTLLEQNTLGRYGLSSNKGLKIRFYVQTTIYFLYSIMLSLLKLK